jgi:hypothetical protein
MRPQKVSTSIYYINSILYLQIKNGQSRETGNIEEKQNKTTT